MYSNLMIDFGIGLVPVAGDLADAWFKCNTRNNLLLEKVLRERGQKHPAPPPEPKQSAMRRFFGPGLHAPGSHPGDHDAPSGHPASTVDGGTVPNVGSTKPELPVRNPPRQATANGKAVRERDLEAQTGEHGTIHYSRDG